ncbi:phosphotransferase [Brachybacterium phenoliresistens]|nr:phosphotransferase [Brachybacterium phenoliresistens]
MPDAAPAPSDAPPDPSSIPQLPGMRRVAEPVLLGRGWDNDMWHVGTLDDGTRVVLRRPYRELGRWALQQEIAALRTMVPCAEFATPQLLAVLGEDEPAGPASLMTWLEGEVVADVLQRRDAGEASRPARLLAGALAQLHRPAPAEHPRSPYRGVPLASRPGRTESDLAALRERPQPEGLGAEQLARVEEILRRGLDAAPWRGPDLLLHGDPHPANLVMLRDGRLGMIDWGDTSAGDPASDLAQLFLLDPGGDGLAAYLDAVRGGRAGSAAVLADVAALEARSRAWAVRFAVMILAHALRGEADAQAPLAQCARNLLLAWSV